jgi:hypothetical protein
MPKLADALTLVTIASTLAGIYDQHVARKRTRELDARDQKIRQLDERLAKLEAQAS